uniref:1,5-anhydro-D-fructose reductase-like n=1 Tax=Styela clava TaxID=7725 RepID=UPI00193984E7|nr:1,5-anhydro-D-fructose reductase-like [Styela clava]XP_039264837.1 1,5-anhydro-D-fructose reductase-like [Styela clava]
MAKRLLPYVNFNNGVKCPIVGFGTYLIKGEECYNCVKAAIDIGYRHIDTAFVYKNEKEVGQAINDKVKEGMVKREDIFVVSKLSSANHKENMVVPALRKTLENLNLSCIDLYLIHAPWSTKPLVEGEVCLDSQIEEDGKEIQDDIDPVETWRGMEECVRLGLARCIGLSNFNKEQTQNILNSCKIKPVTNQVECHHLLNQEKLRKYSQENGVTISAYRSLGGAKKIHIVLGDENIKKLAEKYEKTPAQIILRWIIQRGILAIPKSSNLKRIEENFNVFDFEIDETDMDFIMSLNQDQRFVEFLSVTESKYFPFKKGVEY